MTSPHDTLFHRVMQHPALVAGWLRTLLPARIAAAVDWSTFAPAGERIPGLRLHSQRADLVFAEVLAALDRWSHVLRAVEADDGPPHPDDLLDAFGWYLLDTTEVGEDALQRAFARHLQHPENNPMTTGQRIRAESHSLGLVEGQARLLLKLLQRRFGPLTQDQQDRILNATAEELERWTDRVLDAATFEDVVA